MAAPLNSRHDDPLSQRLTCRIRQLAETSGLCEKTIRNRIRSRSVRTLRAGRAVLIPAEEVPRLLSDAEKPPQVADAANISRETRELARDLLT